MVDFGWKPRPGTLQLARGGDLAFVLIRRSPDPPHAEMDWPVDAEIEIVIEGGSVGNLAWQATINGARAEVDVTYMDVQDVIDAKASAFRIRYWRPSGTPIVWYEGSINVS